MGLDIGLNPSDDYALVKKHRQKATTIIPTRGISYDRGGLRQIWLNYDMNLHRPQINHQLQQEIIR